jgi:hypothetical protein
MNQPRKPVFQAIAVLRGVLNIDTSEGKICADITTETGESVPVWFVFPKLLNWIKKHPELASAPTNWLVYPRFREGAFWAQAVIQALPPDRPLPPDRVKAIGNVVYQDRKRRTFTLKVRRNERPSDPSLRSHIAWVPFKLTFQGTLPGDCIGEVWEVEGDRTGNTVTCSTQKKLFDRRRDDRRSPPKKPA